MLLTKKRPEKAIAVPATCGWKWQDFSIRRPYKAAPVSTAEGELAVCGEPTKMDVGTSVTSYRTMVILYCVSKRT